MSADRHFRPSGYYTAEQLASEITGDVADAHQAGDKTGANEYLDELNDLNAGTWTPKHA